MNEQELSGPVLDDKGECVKDSTKGISPNAPDQPGVPASGASDCSPSMTAMEPGIYWATIPNSDHWQMLVEITGQCPFLSTNILCVIDETGVNVVTRKKVVFGPRIMPPDFPVRLAQS